MAYKEFASYIMEQLDSLDNVRNISMMGGYIFYYKDKIFGGIYDNGNFLVKITTASQRFLPDSVPRPPYDGAKPMLPADDIVDDREQFANMVEQMYDELPKPKPKKKRTNKKP